MAKVRIRAGIIDFHLETEGEFTTEDVKAFFGYGENLTKQPLVVPPAVSAPLVAEADVPKPATANGVKLHVNSVAAKLNAKSGPEVARAAAAYLQIVEGKETFTRAELLSTMKAATKYYKSSMSGNLTGAIETLLNGKLNQIGTDVYALTSSEHAALEAALAT